MKINKNSWHYKLYRLSYSFWNMEEYMPRYETNLCQYCRHTIISLFFATLVSGFLAMMACFCLATLGWGIWHYPMMAKVFGCIVLGIAAIFGAVYYFTSDTSELVGEYIHAKTKGICPTIEFEDDK